MNVEETIMQIKCTVASAEYKLTQNNRAGAEADLRHIHTFLNNTPAKPDPKSKDED